jgi:hypothetical protein
MSSGTSANCCWRPTLVGFKSVPPPPLLLLVVAALWRPIHPLVGAIGEGSKLLGSSVFFFGFFHLEHTQDSGATQKLTPAR